MFRSAENALVSWMKRTDKSPLLIRGARQVGKSYLVESVARQHFSKVVTVNFELTPSYIHCFSTLDPNEILKRLNLLSGEEIRPEDTLLFLDEVQMCPEAIQSLRYFKEKLPALAVIAAGSLLEFVLNDTAFRMPVGRVEFMYVSPMSFKEFLWALGEKNLVDWMESVTWERDASMEGLSAVLHEKCLKLLREYCWVGGMPEVVKTYVQDRSNLQAVQNQQSKLLQGYTLDFGKYAKTNAQYRNLQHVFGRLADGVGCQVKYSRIHPDLPSRDVKSALDMLRLAGLCHTVYGTSGAGIPLAAMANEKKFKLVYVDVGLYLRGLYLDPHLLLSADLTLINEGNLAEQFVGQELLLQHPCFEKSQLYFWARDTAGSQAEVDYVWQCHDQIIPVEVKSGSSGWLKSLTLFRETYRAPFGIRVSSRPLQVDAAGQLYSIPLYLVSEMDRLFRLVT